VTSDKCNSGGAWRDLEAKSWSVRLITRAYRVGFNLMIIGMVCVFLSIPLGLLGLFGSEIAHDLGWWSLCIGELAFVIGGFIVIPIFVIFSS